MSDNQQWKPGPGERFATRRELIIDDLRSLLDALIASAGGALAAVIAFAAIGVALPTALTSMAARPPSLGSQNHGSSTAAAISTTASNFIHWSFVAAGIVVAITVGIHVTRRIARNQPLRGSPIRPTE